jgi:hypothetical protein
MRINLKKKRYFVLFFSIIIIMSILMILPGCRKKEWKNPYEYNLETLFAIDPALILYNEAASISLPFETPRCIAVSREDNRIYAAGDTALVVMNENHEVTDRIDLGNKAFSLAPGEPGILYIGYTDYVEKIDISSKERLEWASLGNEALITSLSIGKDYLFVADAGNHGVYCFTKEGALFTMITGKETDRGSSFIIPSPYFDVAGLPDDTFWVVNPGQHRLEHWTARGEFLGQWGAPGSEVEKFSGCCNPVHMTLLGLDRDHPGENVRFVTAEKGIPRVKVYAYTGAFIGVVASPGLFNPGTTGLDCAAGPGERVYILDPLKKSVRIFDPKDL